MRNRVLLFSCCLALSQACTSTPGSNNNLTTGTIRRDATNRYIAQQLAKMNVRKDALLVDISPSVYRRLPIPDSSIFWLYYNQYRELPGIKTLAFTIVGNTGEFTIRFTDTGSIDLPGASNTDPDDELVSILQDSERINVAAISRFNKALVQRNKDRFDNFIVGAGKLLHMRVTRSEIAQNLEHITDFISEPVTNGGQPISVHAILMTDFINSGGQLGSYDFSGCQVLVLGAPLNRAHEVIHNGHIQIIENLQSGIIFSLNNHSIH